MSGPTSHKLLNGLLQLFRKSVFTTMEALGGEILAIFLRNYLRDYSIQTCNIFCYPASRSLSFEPAFEESPANRDSLASSSSRSDSSESEFGSRFRFPTQRNSSGRRFFVSKPVHPLSLPIQSPARDASDIDHRLSSASSSVDLSFTDASEPLESELCDGSRSSSNDQRCGLCGRFLMQRSPWSSRRIVRSGDLPVAGVLSCHHVFHAECLEQTTSKMHKSDPPCPICAKMEDYNSPERRIYSRLRSNFPRLRTFSEEGPSRPWGCGQVRDCVEGAFHAPPRNSMVLLNRNRLKKNLSLKGASLSKEFPGKVKRSGPCSSSSPFWAGSSVGQSATPKVAVCPSPGSCESL
ncbi:hypothetical protein CRG98_042757 [Punica granatum]|uniref:RING-type domain-containing protein n=1 Tax=Punica granatum TaxID=22663 RepID=A0A2I0HYP6_PUNGR|nr:hypothetical protein CRG98_042757 [Punica granatum]